MIYPVVIALAVAATASANLYVSDHAHQKYMWESFKTEHGRSYPTMEEEAQRFGFFLENLKMADLRNEQERKHGGTAIHGITRFSDLSQAEFESRYLTSTPNKEKGTASEMPDVKLRGDVGLVDWSGVYTTPVKDQGYCGSCWAFSATEQIESDIMRTTLKTLILSPEQIVQCDTKSWGCMGGATESAYAYVKTAGGIDTEADYPYTSYQGLTGTCVPPAPTSFAAGITGFTTIPGATPAATETNMAAYVQSVGPLSVCLDAATWNLYTGGIMSTCGKSVDHCVQAVGVDTTGANPYWKVRNSWGVIWGESGYIRLSYGANTCAITTDATWTSAVLRN